MQLTTRQYNLLERAVVAGRRLAVYRRGSEFVVRPLALAVRGGREVIDTIQPVTGEEMALYLDEIDSFEVVDD